MLISIFQIDIRTAFIGYTIINIVNVILIGALYIQIRDKYPNSFLIFISFVISAFGNTLVFLRDVLNDLISIIAGNVLVVSSTLVLLIGLEHFVNKKGTHIHNYLLIVIFFFVHSYFTLIVPDLIIRKLDISIIYVLLSAQIAWLMLIRVPVKMRKITRGVGLVFFMVFIIQIAHIIVVIFKQNRTNNFFDLDNSEALFILTYQIILMVLAYSLSLMYTKSLIIDVKEQENKNAFLLAEKHQLELDLKNREITHKELKIASLKEVNKTTFNKLKDDLSKVENSDVYEIIDAFKSDSLKSKIWEEFDARFKEANSNFYLKLVENYPTLTANEIRVSCLIRQNYNTKEIAEIIQRSTKTVENIRGLIRKKINLNKDENLTAFLNSI